MTTLKRGMKGEEVKTLQRLLGVTPDGDFGRITYTAVKEYQRTHGLYDDGVVGDKTWAKLMEKANKQVKGCVYIPIDTHITACTSRPIKFIAVHYTAGRSSENGNARLNRKVFLSRKASADFVVDRGEVVQVNPDLHNYYCWSVGDGGGKYKINGVGVTNKNTVSIEMCSDLTSTNTKNGNHVGWVLHEDVLNRTRELLRTLKTMFPDAIVIRHYDASRKNCPGIIGWNDGKIYDPDVVGKVLGKNNSAEWLKFKSSI